MIEKEGKRGETGGGDINKRGGGTGIREINNAISVMIRRTNTVEE